MRTTKDKFFEILKRFDHIPYSQSFGWFEFSYREGIEYWVDSEIDPNIGFWAITTKNKVIGKKLIIDGFCSKKHISYTIIKSFFENVINESGADIIYYSDIDIQSADLQIALRRSGFIRPISLNLCPMSIIVNCQETFKFHRNWRRQVNKSIECKNQFQVVHTPNDEQLEEFVDLFGMLKNRKHLSFSLSKESIKRLTDSPEYFLSFIRNEDGKALCGRMTYLYNCHAYDIFAANSEEGLKTGAVYHNQQSLFEYLKEIGAIDFDYGRIPPGKDEMDSIYISKSYSGGYPVIYNGEWEWCKSNFINWVYNFYRYAIRKAKRY